MEELKIRNERLIQNELLELTKVYSYFEESLRKKRIMKLVYE
jgi:hypothetical protein